MHSKTAGQPAFLLHKICMHACMYYVCMSMSVCTCVYMYYVNMTNVFFSSW